MTDTLLYAPNVHVGGGAVLLEALLRAWPAERPLRAWLDARAQGRLTVPAGAQVRWVQARALDRLAAEWSLHRAARPGDRLLCFHGLPPLWPSAAEVAVFQQNRNYLGQVPLRQFALRTRLRLLFEQQVSRRLRGRVHTYWVQTPSMAEALRRWWGEGAPPAVRVLGFAPTGLAVTGHVAQADAGSDGPGHHDFVYVADGEAHKNHRRLIEAWVQLAAQGLRPSLALTLTPRDAALRDWVQQQAAAHALDLRLLPPMPHAEVLALYRRAGALVFPSLGESYGLPLLEARQAGLPILAGELDFVRDVCEPAQTFDPQSATSIARAVRRHLGQALPPDAPVGADAFLRAWLGTP